MRTSVVALALVACTSETVTVAYRCDVVLATVEPASGAPGDIVAVTGTPFTTSWDTAVYFGATRAAVEAVDRESCDECDECVAEAECFVCADCDACDVLCGACVERATFVVPEVAPGESSIRLFNGHGESDPIPFVVLAKPTDTGDSGAETGDSGP